MITALNSRQRSNRAELDLQNSELTESLVELLFRRNVDLEVTEAMLKAANLPNDLKVLLKRAPNMRVTGDLLEIAASKWGTRQELVTLLLDHDKSVKVPLAVLLCQPCVLFGDLIPFINTLLEHDPELHIPSAAFSDLVRAIQPFQGTQLAELLLKYNKKVDLTEDIRTAIDQKFYG